MKTVLAMVEKWQAAFKKESRHVNDKNLLKSPVIVLMRHDCW